MNHFTFFDFQELNKEEKALNKLLKEKDKEAKPSVTSLNNVLNYSKALSIRKSEQLGEIEQLLN